jgi:hypothetical protein
MFRSAWEQYRSLSCRVGDLDGGDGGGGGYEIEIGEVPLVRPVLVARFEIFGQT